MLKSCPYCGKIHDKKYNCPKKPVRQRQDNRQSKFRSTYKWTKKAQAVKRRDGDLCQGCLRGLYHPERRYETEGLEVHHIQTVASCYEKRLDGYNLLTLCKRHHKMADAGKIKGATNDCSRAGREVRGHTEYPGGGKSEKRKDFQTTTLALCKKYSQNGNFVRRWCLWAEDHQNRWRLSEKRERATERKRN